MAGLEFSFPYNGDPSVLDAQLALNGQAGNRVREVYLNVPQEIAGSGRAGGNDRMTEDEFVRIAKTIHACGGQSRYDHERNLWGQFLV